MPVSFGNDSVVKALSSVAPSELNFISERQGQRRGPAPTPRGAYGFPVGVRCWLGAHALTLFPSAHFIPLKTTPGDFSTLSPLFPGSGESPLTSGTNCNQSDFSPRPGDSPCESPHTPGLGAASGSWQPPRVVFPGVEEHFRRASVGTLLCSYHGFSRTPVKKQVSQRIP